MRGSGQQMAIPVLRYFLIGAAALRRGALTGAPEGLGHTRPGRRLTVDIPAGGCDTPNAGDIGATGRELLWFPGVDAEAGILPIRILLKRGYRQGHQLRILSAEHARAIDDV